MRESFHMAGEDSVPVMVCLDVGSPYSWFCLTVLLRYRERWNLRLTVVPVLLGAIHKATGNATPAVVPARGEWVQGDLRRNAAFMGVPFKGPPAELDPKTFNSMLCQRLLTAVALSKGYESQELTQVFLSLFTRIWGVMPGNDVSLSDPVFVLESCVAAGLSRSEAETFLHQTKDSLVKEELKKNTQLTVERGAFGTPCIFIFKSGVSDVWSKDPLLFIFGSDRFEQLSYLLGKEWSGPYPTWSRL